MAAGWRIFRAREPGANNSVLYVWFFDPAVPGATYALSDILNQVAPADARDLYQTFSESFAGGQSLVNIDGVMNFGTWLHDQRAPASGVAEAPARTDHQIRQHCAGEWPGDYRMRAHCEEQQRDAEATLERGNPPDIPGDVFDGIRARCEAEWTTDLRIRAHCERQQAEGYRAVR